MKRATFVLLALWVASPAAGKDLLGSYSTMRVDDRQMNGAAVAATWRLRETVGVSVQGSLERGLIEGQNFEEWAFLGGPVLTPWPARRLSPFVHVKAGLARSRRQIEVLGVAIGADGICDGGCPYSTGAAAEFGGGLDYRVSDRFSVRVPQVDYRVTQLDEAAAKRLRLSVGIAYRWGD
jgi:hypothetical protein